MPKLITLFDRTDAMEELEGKYPVLTILIKCRILIKIIMSYTSTLEEVESSFTQLETICKNLDAKLEELENIKKKESEG